jgi:predicted nucleic-acid-binding protein
MKVTAYAYRKDGELILRNKAHVLKEISIFQNAEIEITFQKKRSYRSSMQNRYYFGVVVTMIQERFKELGHEGITKELTHEYLKGRFLFKEVVNEVTGEVLKLPLSTTELTKSDFSEYLEQVIKFAAESLDILIPESGAQIQIDV